jgi:hypothetical protein
MRDHDALIRFLQDRASFAFGFDWREPRTQDCFRLVMEGAQAQTGEDRWADVRGRWTSERGAARAILKFGPTLADVLDKRFARVAPALAMRGDIGAITGPKGLTLGIIEGHSVAYCAERGGLERRPRTELELAWSVEGGV